MWSFHKDLAKKILIFSQKINFNQFLAEKFNFFGRKKLNSTVFG